MTPNEEYVLKTLAENLGGQVEEGRNPPDGWIIDGDRKIAVEVTMLVESLVGAEGSYPQLKDKGIVDQLKADLRKELSGKIPDGKSIYIVLGTPIGSPSKVKNGLMTVILEMLESGALKKRLTLHDNVMDISMIPSNPKKEAPVMLATASRRSSTNIQEKAAQILGERIEKKGNQDNTAAGATEYWLALYNYFWQADVSTYRRAYENVAIDHGFDRIYIVNGYGQVDSLYKAPSIA